MLRLAVKSYRAPDAAERCRRNASVHAQVLHEHGLANITSAQPGWWHDEQTQVLLLEDAASEEPLGAVRLQRWGNGVPLPIESALARVDGGVQAWVASFAGQGVGELCGLWCSPRVAGFALGSVLIRMGLSLATSLRTQTVLGLCDTRHVAMNLRFGFERDRALARQGSFEYPRAGLMAHVLRVADARRLERATTAERQAVLGYRSAPLGLERIEGGPGRLELARDLRVAPVARAARPSAPVPRRGDGGQRAVSGALRIRR